MVDPDPRGGGRVHDPLDGDHQRPPGGRPGPGGRRLGQRPLELAAHARQVPVDAPPGLEAGGPGRRERGLVRDRGEGPFHVAGGVVHGVGEPVPDPGVPALRPQQVSRDEGDGAADQAVHQAGADQVEALVVEEVGQEQDHRGDRGGLEGVALDGEGGDQPGEHDHHGDVPPAARHLGEHGGRDDQSAGGAEGAQYGPGEHRTEVGLEDEGDGQRDPVGPLELDHRYEGLRDSDAQREPQPVPPGGPGQHHVAYRPPGAHAQGGGSAEPVVHVVQVGPGDVHDLRGMAQGRVDGAFGRGVRGGQVQYGRSGAALLDGVGQFPYGRRDLGRQRPAAQVCGGRGLHQRDHHVELGQQPHQGGAAPVHPGPAAEHQVVGVVDGLGDLLAAFFVQGAGSAGGLQGVGQGPVGVGHGGALRLSAAQRPAQQGQREDEQSARGQQQRGRPPGLGQRQPGADHGVEQEQQSGHGGDRADGGDHPGDEGDEGERSDGQPAVPVHQGSQGHADGAEELRDRDVEDPHPVGVGGVADHPGEGTHGGERAVLGLVEGESDGERDGHRDRGPDHGGPRDRCGAGLQPVEEPGGRSQGTVPGSPRRYVFGAFGAHSRFRARRSRIGSSGIFCAVPCVSVPSELMGCGAVDPSPMRPARRRARSGAPPRRWCAGRR